MIKIAHKKLITFVFFYISSASAAQTLSFDEKLLKANGISSNQLDEALSRKSLPQGYNKVDLYINSTYISTDYVYYDNEVIYYSRNFKNKSGIRKKDWSLFNVSDDGIELYHLSKVFITKYDHSKRTLIIKMPLTYMDNVKSQSHVDGGVGAFLNYNMYTYRFSGGGQSMSNLNTDYEAGINGNNTVIRTHGYYNTFRSGNSSISRNSIRDIYAERDFNKVRVRAGRSIVNDGGFGTGYIDGAILSSSTGNSMAYVNFSYNAAELVTIEFWQNNILLWKKTVQKGYVELNNIPVTDFTNDVTVLIRQNGQVIDSRIIGRALISTAQSGTAGFYFFSGKSKDGLNSHVTGAGINKKFNDLFHPSFSAITSSRYNGASLNNTLTKGNIRSNMFFATTRNEKNEMGSSLGLSASVNNTSISHSYNSRHFTYFNQALTSGGSGIHSSTSIAQSMKLNDQLTGSISFSRYSFYNTPSFETISAGLNFGISHASVGMNISHNSPFQSGSGKDNINMSLSVNVPLDWSSKKVTLRSQYYNYADTSRFINSLSSNINDYYAISANQVHTMGKQKNNSLSIDNSVITPYTTASISLSKAKQSGYTSSTTAAYFSGAIAASQHGVIFSPTSISDTWAIVDTGVNQYLKVSSLHGSTISNHDGKAIISKVSTSTQDFIRVDPEGLPKGMVITNNIREFSASRGAVPYFQFNTYNNRLQLIKWKNKPSWVRQSDVFYDVDGNTIARFIDRDILLVNENDFPKLLKSGMSSPVDINVKCKLTTDKFNKEEKIKSAKFKCFSS